MHIVHRHTKTHGGAVNGERFWIKKDSRCSSISEQRDISTMKNTQLMIMMPS